MDCFFIGAPCICDILIRCGMPGCLMGEVGSTILPNQGNQFEELEKWVRIDNIQTNAYHLMKKIVKIGPVDPEILWLKFKKKKEINASKIYRQVC